MIFTYIHCNNNKCVYFEKNNDVFKYNKNSITEHSTCGLCGRTSLKIEDSMIDTDRTTHNMAICKDKSYLNTDEVDNPICTHKTIMCDKMLCEYYFEGRCDRPEIFINSKLVGDEDIWECKCFSRRGFVGHRDWSRYPQGGHIDDDYAEKLQHNNEVARSFPDHLRPTKEKIPLKWKLDKKNYKKPKVL
jgi:hypothetical protein